MASGIEWLRWYHGTVDDEKFLLVAMRAKATITDVIAMWALLMERASKSENRGTFGNIDHESVDVKYQWLNDPGRCMRIMEALNQRAMIDMAAGRLTAWDKRQVKRERPEDNSTGRTRAFRDRERQGTPENTEEHLEKIREEQRRKETAKALGTTEEKGTVPSRTGVRRRKPPEPLQLDQTTLAVAAYNKILAVKPFKLPKAMTAVGWPEKQQYVRRCADLARQMCQLLYGNPRVTEEFWSQYFTQVTADPFRSGLKVGGEGHEKWRPDFEYLLRRKTMMKVFEMAGAEDEPE